MKKLQVENTVEELKSQFLADLNREDATAEQTAQAMAEYVTGINARATERLMEEYQELKNVTDNNVLASRGIHVLTAEETGFYNEVQKTGVIPDDELLPETVIERVFDDLQKTRPLLGIIRFVPGVGRQKIITSKRLGKAVWGPLHRDLEGQLDATFDVSETSLKSLTAFFLISNDTLDLGPRWIDRYVRLCLQEAIAEAWEEAIVLGTGNNEPIGLMKDLDGAVVSGEYPDKETAGTLSFTTDTIVEDFTSILSQLSQYEVKYKDLAGEQQTETRYRVVDGRVNLIINPSDYYGIVSQVTTQNANGVFVTNLPFISQNKIIQSEFVPAGKVIVMLDNGYDAQTAYNNRIYVYKETFAMKRATLYAIDVFGDGKPADNSSVLIYDIGESTAVLP